MSTLRRCYATALEQSCGNTSAADVNALTALLYHVKFTVFTSCSVGKLQPAFALLLTFFLKITISVQQ